MRRCAPGAAPAGVPLTSGQRTMATPGMARPLRLRTRTQPAAALTCRAGPHVTPTPRSNSRRKCKKSTSCMHRGAATLISRHGIKIHTRRWSALCKRIDYPLHDQAAPKLGPAFGWVFTVQALCYHQCKRGVGPTTASQKRGSRKQQLHTAGAQLLTPPDGPQAGSWGLGARLLSYLPRRCCRPRCRCCWRRPCPAQSSPGRTPP